MDWRFSIVVAFSDYLVCFCTVRRASSGSQDRQIDDIWQDCRNVRPMAFPLTLFNHIDMFANTSVLMSFFDTKTRHINVVYSILLH